MFPLRASAPFAALPLRTRTALIGAAFSIVLATAMSGAALACRGIDCRTVAGQGTARVVLDEHGGPADGGPADGGPPDEPVRPTARRGGQPAMTPPTPARTP